MRPGLLAAGIILLVLGAIFYFIPGVMAEESAQTTTVSTEVYANGDAGTTYDTTTTTDTTTTDTTTSGGVMATDSDRTVVADTTETRIFAFDDDATTTTVSERSETLAGGGALQRQLAVLAMILGAILTILGLVLPDPEPAARAEATVRTTGAAGRRVTYEREEEIERRR